MGCVRSACSWWPEKDTVVRNGRWQRGHSFHERGARPGPISVAAAELLCAEARRRQRKHGSPRIGSSSRSGSLATAAQVFRAATTTPSSSRPGSLAAAADLFRAAVCRGWWNTRRRGPRTGLARLRRLAIRRGRWTLSPPPMAAPATTFWCGTCSVHPRSSRG